MADDGLTLNLKILSPSTEVEGGVSFPDLPASTTITELRSRIRNAVASKPATERMRLIYRGRVVANDADTLSNVFGPDTIRQNKDQSLHLVLRELPPGSVPSSPAPRAATAPPNPFRPAQAPTPASPPLQTNPFRTIPQPRPNSQPLSPQPPQQQQQNHHHHHHPHHPHHHPIVHQPHLPGNLPPTLEQHLRQTMTRSQPVGGTTSPPGGATSPPGGAAQTPPPIPGQAPFPAFGQPVLPPTGGRTVRQEGIGPNGERWSVTINETNVTIPNLPARTQQNILSRGIPLPPGFGQPPRPAGAPAPADVIDRLLPRIRSILQSARQEMENVRTLFQAQGDQSPDSNNQTANLNPPSWRVDRIREHVRTMTQNLDLVERGLAVIVADASMAQNADVASLRQTANELRIHAEEMNQRLANEQGSSASDPAPSPVGASSNSPPEVSGPSSSIHTSSQLPAQNTAPTMPVDAPPELFLLSSPQGPVGILFDQRGTYTTAPMVSTLPFQIFTNQFARNRQQITGLGQQIAQGSNQLHNQLANMQPTATQQPPPGEQPPNQPQNQAQNQNQPANPNRNANPPEDRMINVAGHLWLIFKLACFVYFFAGGGGWYRPVMLGMVACLVYLAQIGIFEENFNLIRRHFEAVLPVGALAERVAQPRDANNQAQAQQRNGPTRNLTPEQAAQRLLQQRRDQRFGWVRESMRTAERSLAIFVASLWPGIGERMVHAQEERLRAERAADEERQRQEEEARAQAAEAQEQKEVNKEGVQAEGENGQPSGSAKGKERAETAGDAVSPA